MKTDNNTLPTLVSACSKAELAQAYFPQTENPNTARRNLNRWISMNPELSTLLRESGYRERMRILTPRQVALIYHFLGEP